MSFFKYRKKDINCKPYESKGTKMLSTQKKPQVMPWSSEYLNGTPKEETEAKDAIHLRWG